MIKTGLFLVNLILTVGFVFLGFWGIGPNVFFALIAATVGVLSLAYCPLLKFWKQEEFGYFKGLGYLLLILGVSQLLGFLVYAIAEDAFAKKDYMALVFGSYEFVTCMVILIVAYSVSYWPCRARWKH